MSDTAGPTLAELGIVVNDGQILKASTALEKFGAIGTAAVTRVNAALAIGVAGAAAFFGSEFLKNTIEAQNATAQLEAAVKSTGGAAGFTTAQLAAMAGQLQRVSTFSDEAVERAQAILLTFKAIQGVQFNEATAAVADLATRMGGDLQGAALQVGKALQDPTTGLLALRRSGVSFSEAQQQVIKDLQATGHLAEAQSLILKELRDEFGGSAAAARDTLGGALRGLQNDFGDMFEATSKETGALVALINALGGAARAVTEHRETLIAFGGAVAVVAAGVGAFYAALALPALAVWISGIAAATLAAGTLGAAVFSGAAIVAAAALPYIALAAAIGSVTLAMRELDEVQRLNDEEIKGAARDADVLAFFNLRRAQGEAEARTRMPGVFGAPKSDTSAETADQLKAAKDFVDALEAEAFAASHTTEQVRLHKIALMELTDAQRASAVALANRISFEAQWTEASKALQAQLEAVSQALRDQAAAEEALKESQDSAVANDNTISVQNRLLTLLGTRNDVAEELNRLEDTGHAKDLQAIADRQRLAALDALILRARIEDYKLNGLNTEQLETQLGLLNGIVDPVTKVASNWQDATRAIVAAGQATGGLSDSTALLLQNLISVVNQAEKISETLATAGSSVATGDWLALGANVAGLLASVFGGGESPDAKRAREIIEKNIAALQANTDALQVQATGAAQASGADAVRALLASANRALSNSGPDILADAGALGVNAGKVNAIIASTGLTLQQLEDLAGTLHITLDTAHVHDFVVSLQALQDKLKQNEFAHFAETFAGQMQLVAASFTVFDTKDPLEKLRQTIGVLSDIDRPGLKGFKGFDSAGRPINIPDGPAHVGTGSQAFETAFHGLDVSLARDRAQAIANLQDIFRQIQSGSFDTTLTGGLTLQQFVEQLTGTIDQLRQVEDAAKQRDDALQATVDSLHQFRDSLKLSDLTTLSPVQQLAEAQRQYQAIFARAQAGDQVAAAQLPDAARQFLTADRAVNASGPQFAADFARVLADSDALANMFAGQKSLGELQLTAGQGTQENTKATVEKLQDLIAVQSEGMQQLIDQLDALRTESAENSRKLTQAIEGGKL